ASSSSSAIFWPKPSIAEPGSEENDDQSRSQTALDPPPMRAGLDLAGVVLSSTRRRDAREPRTDAHHRRSVHGNAVVWLEADGPAPASSGLVCRPQAGPAADAQNRPVADLPGTQDQRAASAAP